MKKQIGVIGGGILGLSLAYKIQIKYPNKKVYVFEKESSYGIHQSGTNSGVLHCGLNYLPGSLKAKLSVEGIDEIINYSKENKLPYDVCGKIIVANTLEEEKSLEILLNRGIKNGVKGLKILTDKQLKTREPYVKASKSLLVPNEGIIDFSQVMKSLVEKILINGGEVIFDCKINKLKEFKNNLILYSDKNEWLLDKVYNCSGLFSDIVYNKLTNKKRPFRIIPFRGEYFQLSNEASKMVNHLIYPVANPKFPFLGVHFTRLISGEREVGPNAVLALKREGYSKQDFSLRDSYDSLSYKGLYNFIKKNYKITFDEFLSSFYTKIFLKNAQKLIPEITEEMLIKKRAGVRAQALREDGSLHMDFEIISFKNQIHILNAPSPGATACFSIANYILDNENI